jgi:hypothetical protein
MNDLTISKISSHFVAEKKALMEDSVILFCFYGIGV